MAPLGDSAFRPNVPITLIMEIIKPLHNGVGVVIVIFVLLGTTGCGAISDVVNLNYGPQDGAVDTQTSSPFLGLSSASGVRSSGAFELNGGVGNQASSAVKTSGQFTLHGGIQGLAVSQ